MQHLLDYAYTEEDDEFYDRALANYPSSTPALKVKRAECGVVYITKPGAVAASNPPYTKDQVEEIVRGGQQRAKQGEFNRPLDRKQTDFAKKNRQAARGDLAAMEEWYRDQVRNDVKGSRLQRARGGPEDDTLRGIELGDAFWQPVEW